MTKFFNKKSHVKCSLVSLAFIFSLALTAIACNNEDSPALTKKELPQESIPVSAVIPAPAEVAPANTVPEADAWKLILVNEENPLPAAFSVETKKLANGKEFDSRAFDDLQAMLTAAEKDGVQLLVCSSYRSVEYQTGLFNRKITQYVDKGYSQDDAYATAKTIVAIPGTSEHNLGLAADIVTPKYQTLDSGFDQTPAFAWLSAHAADYGFILRYPNHKEDITGIIYEPWHYRYVGQTAAQEITASSLCLEEYLDSTFISPVNDAGKNNL